MVCVATFQQVEAFTNQPMAARHGNSSDFTTQDRSARYAFIQPIPTSFGSLPSATFSNQMKKEVCSRQLTAAKRGARFCFFRARWGRWMWNCNPESRMLFMPGCHDSNGNHGQSSAVHLMEVFTKVLMAVSTSPKLGMDCRES